ncbi:hypothetical protein ONE63_008421 [Megalurothrips usitatus]|uniref:Uncharacterized protein n=1 Tax=Megalurothrips usitatus TaxID=439358 RepID=A0AAV7XPG3_9NEOP|nr:hypothetical protein ONE63_008421 [Megalurothrips usitatus]
MAPESGTEGLRGRANGRPHPLGPEGGDVTAAAQHKEFKSPLDKKYHQDRSALLGPGKGLSLTGFMNLLFCLTTLAAVGLLLENINKYGLRVHVAQWVHAFDARNGSPGFYPAAYLLLCE